MISNDEIKRITREQLEESFYSYFSKAKKETKHIILDRFFPDERRTTSTMTGLQTSLGTFWEKLSLKLAIANGFAVIENKELKKPKNIPALLSVLINEVKKEREDNGGDLNNLKDKLDSLYPAGVAPNEDFEKITKGKGSDLILKKGSDIYLFDIKTVQVNANGGNSFNETLILWIAYYKYKYRVNAHDIHARLAFPYNSANELDDVAWWNDFQGRVSPLTPEDVYIGNQFWSFLTDNDSALSNIIDGFEDLSETPWFIELYKQAFTCNNQDDLKEFSQLVKLNKIKLMHSVELVSYNPPLNLQKKHAWKHDG